MDLRGYGGSDKTPRGYDPLTLAQDVAGVVKSLGERNAIVVGHGWGGYIGWAAAALHPREVTALCAVSAPHPLLMLRNLHPRAAALAHLLAMQVPMRPERNLMDPTGAFLRSHLNGWSAPGSRFPDDDTVAHYQAAMDIWPAPHCALEYHRWLVRSRFRADGRRFNRLMQKPISQPVCAISGTDDPALAHLVPDQMAGRVVGAFSQQEMPGVGHFPPEEEPDAFTDVLLGWLATLP